MIETDIRISVLIPVYNVEQYLEQCLQSIVSQTYPNLQIIVINDGSTDNSRKIIDKYERLDERIEVIHKENTGYGNSMNLGIIRANGDYIGILESDDFATSDMYQILAEAASQTNADVIKGCNYEYSDRECTIKKLFEGIPCNQVICPREHPAIFRTQCNIWAGIYKRSFLYEKDIWFSETPGASYQDTAFSFKIWASSESAYLLESPLVYYRVDNWASSVKSVAKVYCILDEIREVEEYINRMNICSNAVIQMSYSMTFSWLHWNFHRIDDVVRYAFWVEMKKKCIELSEKALQKAYWQEEFWEDFCYFVKQPAEYLARSLQEYRVERLDRYTSQKEMWLKTIEWQIQQYSQVVIYGAGLCSQKVLRWFERHNLKDKIIGYAITGKTKPEEMLGGISVRTISEYENCKDEILVIVGVSEKNQYEILTKLRSDGFKNVIRYDSYFL